MSTLTPAASLSGIDVFGVAVKSVVVPPPPLPPSGATASLTSFLTFATSTFGFDGEPHVPVGDHRKSIWLFSVSVK